MPTKAFRRSRAIGVEVEAFVVEEALAGLQPDMALAHVALDDVRRGVARIVERLGEIAAGVIENVAAAPVDELEQAETAKRKPKPYLIALSISSAVATPSSTIRAASFIASAWMRGTM